MIKNVLLQFQPMIEGLCSVFYCTLLCVHSGFAVVLLGRGGACCFAWFVFLVSRGCCVALLRSAMGLSAVYDCGIS